MYHRPYPWTPMYPNVPMLGQDVTAEEAMLTAAAVSELQHPSSPAPSTAKIIGIGAAVILGIMVAGWAAAPEVRARLNRRRAA